MRKKMNLKWVRLPRFTRDLETAHLRPSNLAAKTLRLVEHTISKFGVDPCPGRPRLEAAAKCYVRKARFSLCRQ